MTTRKPTNPASKRSKLVFAVLSGLTALGVVLQGLWAGIFLSSDNRPDAWVHIHDIGAWATMILAIASAVWAVLRLRRHLVLLVGSILLVLLVAGEAHLGGMITDNGDDTLTAVHVPLAMVLLGVAVWLPVQAALTRRGFASRTATD